MNRLRYIGAFCVALLAMGCEQSSVHVTTTEHTVPAEVTTTLAPLTGEWQVHPMVWTDCPNEWHRTLPHGLTVWQLTDKGLSIQGTMASTDPIWLNPTSAQTLEQENHITAYDCQVTENLVLVIDQLSDLWAEGVFSARLSHDGSAACQALASEAGLPEQCETVVHWRARRTSTF